MTDIYFYLFIGLLVFGIFPILRSSVFAYQYGGFMPLVFAIFILPQVVSLMSFPGILPPDAVEAVLLMTCLCLAASIFGYRLKPWKALSRSATVHAKEGPLLIGGIVLLATSAYFNFLISQMTEEETGGSMWTGKVTIYLFFTGGTYLATAIFLRHALVRRSEPAFLLFLLSLISPLQAAIFAGRRENTVQILMTIGLVLYFEKGIKPPRLAVIGSAALAMLMIPATGTYRSIATNRDWDQLQQLDLVENFKTFLTTESNLELRLAGVTIYNTMHRGDYVYGVGYWDEIIWRFVPAQFVGKGFKDSLMFARTDELGVDEGGERAANVGTTQTGMADSFRQFGYFGALFFVLAAVFYKSIWYAATRKGAVFAQFFYIGTATSGMRAVTHQTSDFLPGVIYQLIFVGFLYLIAHREESSGHGGGRLAHLRPREDDPAAQRP